MDWFLYDNGLRLERVNRGMLIKDTEGCIPETFQIWSTKIKFADIHPNSFIVKIFLVSIIGYFGWQFLEIRSVNKSRKVWFRKIVVVLKLIWLMHKVSECGFIKILETCRVFNQTSKPTCITEFFHSLFICGGIKFSQNQEGLMFCCFINDAIKTLKTIWYEAFIRIIWTISESTTFISWNLSQHKYSQIWVWGNSKVCLHEYRIKVPHLWSSC